MEQVADKTLPPGTGYEWTAMSYQEKAVGGQIYYVFGLAMLLVYLVLAGQYESWYAPISVILAVPLSLLGPMAVLRGLGIDNNLYVQIGLILLIALSAKKRDPDRRGRSRTAWPRTASHCSNPPSRLRAPASRPILMTSFAFILGVVPLVLATGRRRQRAQVDRHQRCFPAWCWPRPVLRCCSCPLLRRVQRFRELAQRTQKRLRQRTRSQTGP